MELWQVVVLGALIAVVGVLAAFELFLKWVDRNDT